MIARVLVCLGMLATLVSLRKRWGWGDRGITIRSLNSNSSRREKKAMTVQERGGGWPQQYTSAGEGIKRRKSDQQEY